MPLKRASTDSFAFISQDSAPESLTRKMALKRASTDSFAFISHDSLPESLVHPVIVKNTFLDFDDSAIKRLSRRWKTEGAAQGWRTSTTSTLESDGSDDDQSTNTSPLGSEISVPTGSSESGATSIEHEVPVSLCGSTDSTLCVDDISLKAVVAHFPSHGLVPSVAGVQTPEPTEVTTSIRVFESHVWTVDAKKLRGNDRSAVSRPFLLAIGGPRCPVVTCKMMIYAKTMADRRGGQSFKLSGGQGSLQLKCEQDLDSRGIVDLRFSVGANGASRQVQHDFSESAACTSQDWDFSKLVDKKAQTFAVHVEVVRRR